MLHCQLIHKQDCLISLVLNLVDYSLPLMTRERGKYLSQNFIAIVKSRIFPEKLDSSDSYEPLERSTPQLYSGGINVRSALYLEIFTNS